jgi:hypothetical protein
MINRSFYFLNKLDSAARNENIPHHAGFQKTKVVKSLSDNYNQSLSFKGAAFALKPTKVKKLSSKKVIKIGR